MSENKNPASLTAMENQLKKTEKEISSLEKQYNDVISQIESNQIDLEFAKGFGDTEKVSLFNSNQAKLDYQSVMLATQLENARDKSEKLKKSLEELKINPQSSMEAQNLKARIDLATSSIEKSKKEANELAKNIENASKKRFKGLGVDAETINEGFEKINSKIDKFKSKIFKLVGAALVFNLIKKGLNALINVFSKFLNTNDTFTNNLNQIRANLMTAFAPIYNYVLPAINALMNALSKITGSIASFVSGIFGQTAEQAKQNAKSLYEQANAQNAVNEAQEGLASFDKLEVNNDSNLGTNGSNGGINFNGEMQVNQKLLNYLNEIKELIGNGEWFEVGSKLAKSLNKVIDNIDIKGFFKKGNEIATNIILGINGFINNFDFGLLASKLSDFILGIGSLILTCLSTIDWEAIGQAIGDFIFGIDWLGILSQFLSIVATLIEAIFKLAIGLLGSIGGHLGEWILSIWEKLKQVPT